MGILERGCGREIDKVCGGMNHSHPSSRNSIVYSGPGL